MAQVSVESDFFEVSTSVPAPPERKAVVVPYAFQTGTVSSRDELWDVLDKFLTEKAGWEVGRVYGPRDTLYMSFGSDGKATSFIRLDTTPPSLDPSSSEQLHPHINVRGYGAFDGATASLEYGRWGPAILYWNTLSNAACRIFPTKFSDFRDLRLPHLDGSSTRMSGVVFDDRSTFFARNVNTKVLQNFRKEPGSRFRELSDTSFDAGDATVRTTNARGETVIYSTEHASPYAWKSYNVVSGEIKQYSSGVQRSSVVWDGGDYIYGFTYNSAGFERFSISDETWTSLPNVPGTTNAYTTTPISVYIPASVGFLDPLGEPTDVILHIPPRTAASTISRRFYVSTGAWESTAIPLPFSAQHNGCFLWDGNQTLFYMNAVAGQIATANLPDMDWSTPLPWASRAAANQNYSYVYANHAVAKIPVLQSPSTYWIAGDSDGVVIATETAGESARWSYFGRFAPAHNPHVALTEDAISVGSNTVTVDDVGSLRAGERVMLYDSDTGACEAVILTSVSGAQVSFDATLSFPSGCLIGVDPAPVCVAGDSGLAITPFDAFGYETQMLASSYLLNPIQDPSDAGSIDLRRAGHRALDLELYGTAPALPETNERRGVLPKVTVLTRGSGVLHREVLQVGGRRTLALVQEESKQFEDGELWATLLLIPME